jgi:hypothetical protein
MARMIISRISNDKVEIIAIGAYSERKILEIKTIADSPGKPIFEKMGVSNDAICSIKPQYSNRLTEKLMGNIIFNNHQIVFPAFGKAVIMLVYNRLEILIIGEFYIFNGKICIKQERLSPDNPIFKLTLNLIP